MDINNFSTDQLAIIYRSVYFESRDYEPIDNNGYLGQATREILEMIENHAEKAADPFYVSNKISKAI